MPKGPSTTQYIGGIVADQLSKMAATNIGSSVTPYQFYHFLSLSLKLNLLLLILCRYIIKTSLP